MKDIRKIQPRVSDIRIYDNAEQIKLRHYGELEKYMVRTGFSIIGLDGDNDLYIPYVKTKRLAKKIASRAFREKFKAEMLQKSKRKKMRRCDLVNKILQIW